MCVCAPVKALDIRLQGRKIVTMHLLNTALPGGLLLFFSFYLTRCHSVKSVRKACPYKGLPLTLKYSFDVAIPGE